MYINESLRRYIEEVAAKKPAPGGGSVSGACGALGVALLEMVCNFTSGKEEYKDVEKDMQVYLTSLKKIQDQFIALVDKDVDAYLSIRDAFRTKDKKNIDKALKDGYDISLNACRLCKGGLKIAEELPAKGNPNLITDVGCGAELLNAAFNSGAFNAEINLKGIKDPSFIEKERKVLDALKKEIGILYKDAISNVKERMK